MRPHVRVVLPETEDGEPQTANGTKVLLVQEDGSEYEIPDVKSIKISELAPDKIVEAHITLGVSINEIQAVLGLPFGIRSALIEAMEEEKCQESS